jgi:mono/diheme cytochrome c family protein
MKKVLVAVSCLGLALSAGLLVAQEKGTGNNKAAAGDAAKGKDAFGANCMICHSPDSDARLVGPGLKDLFKHAKLGNEKAVNDANVMEIINQGSPNGMPPFGDALTAPEKADILAYLKTL